MRSAAASATPTRYVSSCLLDGVATTAWVDLTFAGALLRPWALPAPTRGCPRGKHPLLIEAWRVKAGKWESSTGDQHAWAERVGALVGLSLGGQLFRRWSEAAAHAGSYSEVVLTVPARLRGRGETCAFVAAMYTDSPVARWGDLAMQCGYRKRLARITWPTERRCEVASSQGDPLLTVEWRPEARRSNDPALALASPRLSMPFLGGLDRHRYAISMMERRLDEPSSDASAVTARASWGAGLVEGLPAQGASTRAISSRSPLGAFQFRDVPTRLTYPHHASL